MGGSVSRRVVRRADGSSRPVLGGGVRRRSGCARFFRERMRSRGVGSDNVRRRLVRAV